jgi:hypothetical protein
LAFFLIHYIALEYRRMDGLLLDGETDTTDGLLLRAFYSGPSAAEPSIVS